MEKMSRSVSLVDAIIAKARSIDPDRQNEIGEMVLAVVEQETSNVQLSASQQAEVRRRLARSLELVADSEMRAFFEKHSG